MCPPASRWSARQRAASAGRHDRLTGRRLTCHPVSGRAAGGRRRWRWFALSGLVLFALISIWTAAKVNAAGQAGYDGKEALESAESAIAKGDVHKADKALDDAEASFTKARSEVHSLGPIRAVARQVPLARTQVRAAESFAGAGLDLTAAARRLTLAAHRLLDPNDPHTSVADAVKNLEDIQVALNGGITELHVA